MSHRKQNRKTQYAWGGAHALLLSVLYVVCTYAYYSALNNEVSCYNLVKCKCEVIYARLSVIQATSDKAVASCF